MAARWQRMFMSALSATLLVIGLLAIGLHFFYRPQEIAGGAMNSFEIEYLTPEEAAALLREQPQQSVPAPINEEASPR